MNLIKKTMAKLAFFWPYFYDPPAPGRPLIQMMHQERGQETHIPSSHLIASHLQEGVRLYDSETNVDKITNTFMQVLKVYSWFWLTDWSQRKVKTPLSISLNCLLQEDTHIEHLY